MPATFEEASFILGALFMLVLALVVLRLRKAWRSRALRARFDHAADGEARAARFLESLGYTVLGAQVSTDYTLSIDDREISVRLRADYLVEYDGRRLVAEVKTGALATQIEHAATRRQLLEYLMAFEVDGVLLVDIDQECASTVTFGR
ncbi:MAG: hypothetical protein U0174_10260 [Polyangiaceae bacterium]